MHALDEASVEVIEVSHGDGLGGSSFNYGFSLEHEFDLIAAAVDEAQNARIAVLLLPGLGTIEHLRRAHDAGASVARIATHCTEADVSIQHFGAARDLSLETVGFLTLSHRIGPAELLGRRGVDVQDVLAAADEVVRPTLDRLPFADRAAIVQGVRRRLQQLPPARRAGGRALRRARARNPAEGRRGRLRGRAGRHDHRHRDSTGVRPVIKLDKSFVEGIEAATPAGQAVARAVVQLAASLELEGVAEGVANLEQIRLLREFGYQLGQGYHFSRPLTAEQFGRLLAETGGFVDVRSSLALLRGSSG